MYSTADDYTRMSRSIARVDRRAHMHVRCARHMARESPYTRLERHWRLETSNDLCSLAGSLARGAPRRGGGGESRGPPDSADSDSRFPIPD